MGIELNLTGLGVWEIIYSQRFRGTELIRRETGRYIEPVEIPILTESEYFLFGNASLNSPITWQRAGYLYQQIAGINVDDTVVFPGLNRVPSTEVDYQRRLIRLNNVQLIEFPKISDTYRLRFESMPWIREISITIWEYVGPKTDSTEELLNVVRAKLETIENKIDQL